MTLRQPLHGAAEKLYEASLNVPVIDTHEHIPRSEAEYNEREIRFGNLFIPYITNDLASAGMPGFLSGKERSFVCIEDDWDSFGPWWQLSNTDRMPGRFVSHCMSSTVLTT